jgi:hypothetical protein
MALTVIETPGAANANSYVTLVEANDYMLTRLHSETWDTFDDEQKKAAIISATSWLDALVRWTGAPTTTTQILGWPRTNMFTRNEQPIPPMVLPFDLKKATSEFAFSVINEEFTAAGAGGGTAGSNVSEIEAGPVRLKFADKPKPSGISGLDADIAINGPDFAYLMVPAAVRALIPPSWYLRPTLATATSKSALFRVDR